MREKISLPLQIAVNDSTFLRVLRPEDAPSLFEVVDRNRERLSVWLPWVPGTKTVVDSLSFIEGALKDVADNTAFPYGIWYEDKLVGVAGAISWDGPNRIIEIGTWIDAACEGRWIVSSCFRAMLEMIFDKTDIEVIHALTEPANKKSDVLVRRLGFNVVGQTHKTDSRGCRLFNVYQLKRSDWPQP